jgi:hypothetical protein
MVVAYSFDSSFLFFSFPLCLPRHSFFLFPPATTVFPSLKIWRPPASTLSFFTLSFSAYHPSFQLQHNHNTTGAQDEQRSGSQ